MTNKPKSLQQPFNELRARLDRAEAIAEVQAAEITALKISNAQLRKKAKLDVPPATAGSDWLTVKQAAYELGMSLNGVKYHLKHGTLRGVKRGGRVLVDRKTMPNGSAQASRRPG
jgi:hypothetical protein